MMLANNNAIKILILPIGERFIAIIAATNAPRYICPSPPRFIKFALYAIEIPVADIIKGAAWESVFPKKYGELRGPMKIW